jgi:hypothetical protein
MRSSLRSWVSSASPSDSSCGGRYTPNRPRSPFLRPYHRPTGSSGERPTPRRCRRAPASARRPPRATQPSCAVSQRCMSSMAEVIPELRPADLADERGRVGRVVAPHLVLGRTGPRRQAPGILSCPASGRPAVPSHMRRSEPRIMSDQDDGRDHGSGGGPGQGRRGGRDVSQPGSASSVRMTCSEPA